MKLKKQWLGITMMLAAALCASGAITNSVPWGDSFETYTNGTLLAGTNGWAGAQADAGTVTSNPEVANLLTNYPVLGKTYPVTGSHTNMLILNAEMVNHVRSVTGGVVKVDFMTLTLWQEALPQGDTSAQYQVCISSNGFLTVWHHNRTAGTNEWRELSDNPVVSSNQWNRITLINDYSNQMFQVAVNEGTPLTNGAGWTAGGGSPGGSWFCMVQTNGVLSYLSAQAAGAYLDDVVTVRRSVSWSRTNFTESVTNNGAIDNSAPLLITLDADTFSGAVGEDFAVSGKVTVGGLPSNLVAVVQMVSTTQVSITLTNVALAHEAVNSTNLTLQFGNTAFTLRSAWDVTGFQTNVALLFLDTPRLSYSTNHFSETPTNNGTMDNSSPVLISLTNGTFAGTVGEDFATNASKLAMGYLPSGLTGEVVMLSATQLQFRLLWAATQNNVANNTNVTFALLNGAFNTVPASSVFNVSTNFSISFIDPSDLTYGTEVFTETVANNGAVGGTTLTLVNKSFDAANGEDMVASGKVAFTNLPGGLGLQVVRGVTAQAATLIFTGTATSNAAVNSISNLGVTFLNSAFVGANAAGVVNSALTNLQIQFENPHSLTYSGTSFMEISGGTIDNRNPVTITLTGDTLTGTNGSDFVAAGKITVSTLPTGLTAVITKNSATQLSVQFAGRATPNTSGSSMTGISFTFQNGAFSAGYAAAVGGYVNAGISITFTNDTGFFNVMPYQEPFEEYAAGMRMAGTNGWSGWVDAGMVTNVPAQTSNLVAYAVLNHTYPIASATHTQILCVQDSLLAEIHSEAAENVFVDFMTLPGSLSAPPPNDLSQQWALYVATNGTLVVWQQTRGGSPVNEWITLSNAPAISTSQWVRFTVESDYVNDMFQIRVNQSVPVTDSRGRTSPGGSFGGSWFYMVQTNHVMTSFEVSGEGFLDDLTVNAALVDGFYNIAGSVYFIR